VIIRFTLLLAGAAFSTWVASASAAVAPYSTSFDDPTTPIGSEWSIGALSGSALPVGTTNQGNADPTLLHTRFLGDFGGNDQVNLHLTLPQHVATVTLSFDVYLVRTWDGNDPQPILNARPGEPTTLGGPDIFGYGYNTTTLLAKSFSHGAGLQSYCVGPTRGIDANGLCQAPANGYLHDPTFDYALQDKLGFAVLLDPQDTRPGVPQVGDPMSMVYHLTSTVPYTGSDIDFKFFSSGLQVHDPQTEGVPRLSDESWGLDNVKVNVTFVPEPQLWVVLAAGLLLTGGAISRRSRLLR
jgi:hypothetical protein